MIASVGCLLVALACQDVDRALGPTKTPPNPIIAASSPVLVALTCTLARSSAAISCKAKMPSVAAGVSASVIYGATATYAIFFPYNLVKDTVAQTWAFTAYLQNLLKQSIGTLNGTAVTGVKVFVTDFHATAGTGAVSVANADGTGNFTAPNQPYFNYNQIVAPSGYSGNKLWKFNVPNTVTAVSMSILVSTDFPAEQTVTLAPPDTIPTWVHSDTSLASPTATRAGNFTKRIVKVRFRSTATLADRQLAIAFVNGTVVGGKRPADGVGGYYLVQVTDDGTGSGILAAAKRLTALPQVESAIFEVSLQQLYLKPDDGGDYKDWRLNPDSADLTKKRWSLEAVDAPFAWGCSNGSFATTVGIVDAGFHAITDLLPNIQTTSAAFSFPSADSSHGTYVSSILAAAGGNRAGMTGVLWYARLLSGDPSIDSTGHKHYRGFYPDQIGEQAASLAAAGARVVNLSWGREYQTSTGAYYAPADTDSAFAAAIPIDFLRGLRDQQRNLGSRTPLLVVGAGNFAHSGNHAQVDAWWSGLPQIKDSLHDTVIVVGASDPHRNVAWFSGANISHQYVDIMAPGDSVYSLDRNSSLRQISGTSMSTPLVTGSAGLLIAFDATLGSFDAGHGAPELRRLILSGADSNFTAGGSQRMAGSYRFLSLYKPLVLAAQRRGGPLRRNRVWLNGNHVIVRRTSILIDTIFTAIGHDFVWAMTSYHGGRRMDVTQGGDTLPISLYQTNGTWAQALGVPTDYTLSGSQFSHSNYYELQSFSHNGDSSVLYEKLSGWDPSYGGSVRFVIQDSLKNTVRTLGTIPHNVVTVWAESYSPMGDAIYAATDSYPWIGVQFWRVPMSGATPTLLWTMPTGLAASIQVSEDGTELAVDEEQDNYFMGFPCWTEYRKSTTGALLDSVNVIQQQDCSIYHEGGSSASLVKSIAVQPDKRRHREPLRSLFARP